MSNIGPLTLGRLSYHGTVKPEEDTVLCLMSFSAFFGVGAKTCNTFAQGTFFSQYAKFGNPPTTVHSNVQKYVLFEDVDSVFCVVSCNKTHCLTQTFAYFIMKKVIVFCVNHLAKKN